MLQPQDNDNSCNLLQERSSSYQNQRLSHQTCQTRDPSFKAIKLILLIDRHCFIDVDMRIRIKGGGHTSQIYVFYQKYVDQQSNKEIKDILVRYDRTLLVVGLRLCEPSKFGGRMLVSWAKTLVL
ncbi:hypothetical protein J1N35_042116 [Gossypium stocksii]|uniref:Uncharacterized protein n=1 Tax=Gossypium stocksii TaxID=47602 RepID=A0A9D3UIN9_9ROSI|nr:hypothetical protein J1N35_042116 [Gossypium stocksii]